jgi:hypothetical protein
MGLTNWYKFILSASNGLVYSLLNFLLRTVLKQRTNKYLFR